MTANGSTCTLTPDITTSVHEHVTLNVTDVTNVTGSTMGTAAARGIDYVGYVTVPVLCFIGLVGNVLNILIMRTKNFKASTFGIFLTCLAVSDTTYLLTSPFTRSVTKDLFQRDVRALSVAGCKAFFCIFRSGKICSSWFVVTICLERFLVVWFPLRAKIIATRRTAVIVCASIFICIYAIDASWTITTDVIKGICHPNVITPATKDIATGFVVFGTLIFNIIPTALLLVLTPLIIFKLFRQRQMRRMIAQNTGSDDTFRATVMLLSVTIAYIILVTPISVAHSVAFFQGDSIFESTEPSFVVFRELAQIMEQTNYSINFFLYVVTNSRFRQGVLTCMTMKKRRHRLEQSDKTDPSSEGQNFQRIDLVTTPSVSTVEMDLPYLQ